MEGEKIMKIRAALIYGYKGTNFYGLQKLPNNKFRSVEGEIEKALFKLGMISAHNYGDILKSGIRSASRTDKGVHAAMNVTSCKLRLTMKYSNITDKSDNEEKTEGA